MEVDNEGEFGGLGIEISTVDGQLVVKVPLEDTPAFRAGLKPDDRIVRIEGEHGVCGRRSLQAAKIGHPSRL